MIGLELTSNFAKTVLASPINASATTITLFPGAGALFPNPSGGNYFRILITDIATSNYNEIVLCTARSGDVLTVTRNAEGTLARSWLAGDIIENVMTAGAFSELRSQGLNSNTAIGALSLDSVTTGANNSAVGTSSLRSNTTGTGNSTLGYQSARYLSNGSTALTIATNSTYIGSNTKASANNVTNETVIGYNAIGSGSNTVTIGGSAVTGTVIPYGNLSIGGSTTISVTDNTNAALRITQLGTGNALVVEDSTNPDSTPFVIDNAGRVGIGAVPSSATTLTISTTATGNVTQYGVYQGNTIQSDVTTQANYFTTSVSTQGATFTIANLRHYQATQGTFGLNSSITTQSGYSVNATVIGATNNYAFQGNIASGTGRYNLYMAGTADNYLAGSLGIGAIAVSNSMLLIGGNDSLGSVANIILNQQTISTSTTSAAVYYDSYANLAASAFTLNAIYHYRALSATLSGGAVVTNQYGFFAGPSLTGATNNCAFQGSIASGTGRYNLYMGGTANNYLGGPLITAGLKATSAAAPTLASATTIAPTTQIAFVSGTTAIATITAPSPISLGGGQITLIPTGIFTTTTAGNIALASTAVVGKALIMTYDATTTKWYPSY